jgi:MYXO-CTERM domain-containing protein
MIARVPLVALALLAVSGRVAVATPVIPPPACVAATLDAYIALGSGGCSIADEVAFFDFDFAVLASGGGATPIGASDILVTPTFAYPLRSLEFSSAGFTVTGTESVSYLVVYSVDPHPILYGFALDMEAFSPVAPGVATVTADICIGAAFGGTLLAPTCGATADSLTVTHDGITPILSAASSFGAPVADVGVRSTISLAANGASADFTSFTTSLVPEPGFLWLAGAGALGLLSRRRRPRQ